MQLRLSQLQETAHCMFGRSTHKTLGGNAVIDLNTCRSSAVS